ncbi:MAG: ABC transporter permease subunit [Candidatus Limnocylindrales bacterium]
MSRRAIELVAAPLRQLRRSAVGWGIGLAVLVGLTIAFWPLFAGSSAITDAIESLPPAIVDAFGLAEFGTPAGFLRGNLYEFIVPLLLAIAAVAVANTVTAAEEDSGRLETYLAQPVSRTALFVGRIAAVTLWMVAIVILLLVVQLASDAVVGLQIDTDRVVATVVLCGLLALLHGALALALAGWLPRPALVLSIGIAVVIGGYLVAALFPLSDTLKPLADASPWSWALGGDPLVNATEPWRYLALLVPTIALAGIGVLVFGRRDVRAA